MDKPNSKTQIELNDYLNTRINKAIKLYDAQIDHKDNSQEWKQLEEQINTLCIDIGRFVMYDKIDLPF